LKSNTYLDAPLLKSKLIYKHICGTPKTLSSKAYLDASISISTEKFSLANILDFEMRKNVAQLMAVAPGIPVKDLHDLLIEKKGEFECARDHVFRYSQTPFSGTPDAILIEDSDDEAEVKIDLNNPEIYNNNDRPIMLPPPPRPKARKPKQPRSKKPRSEAKQQRKKVIRRIAYLVYGMKSQSIRVSAKANVKKVVDHKTPKMPCSLIDDFIIQVDEESECDYSYEGSSSSEDWGSDEASDAEMEDLGHDLRINMSKPFIIRPTIGFR
jgi:hypothetical protein